MKTMRKVKKKCVVALTLLLEKHSSGTYMRYLERWAGSRGRKGAWRREVEKDHIHKENALQLQWTKRGTVSIHKLCQTYTTNKGNEWERLHRVNGITCVCSFFDRTDKIINTHTHTLKTSHWNTFNSKLEFPTKVRCCKGPIFGWNRTHFNSCLALHITYICSVCNAHTLKMIAIKFQVLCVYFDNISNSHQGAGDIWNSFDI